jgi:hypothetical protein
MTISQDCSFTTKKYIGNILLAWKDIDSNQQEVDILPPDFKGGLRMQLRNF